MNRNAVKKMILLHGVLLAGILLFPLYVWISEQITSVIPGCLLHDWFLIYCPLCGGTRAVEALLRLDFLSALRYNAFVVLLAVTAVAFYVMAWIRLKKREDRLFLVPKWLWVVYAVLLLVFFVVRNLLMVGFGMDPLGDLHWFWNQIR